MLNQRSYDWNLSFSFIQIFRAPQRAPLFDLDPLLDIIPRLSSARRAPWTGTKPFLPDQLSADMRSCEGRGWSGNNLWQIPSCSANGQTNTLIHPPPPLNPRTGLCQLWRCHYWRSRRFLAFCVPPHSALLIPSSPFKPVCFLSVNASMHPPPPRLESSSLLHTSVCLCL